jgi:hypothetical protein
MNAKVNMELWNARQRTDPEYVKKVNQRGGFSAIAAQWQRMQATEEWGPYGLNWGLTDLRWDYIGASGDEPPLEICLEATFYYGRVQNGDMVSGGGNFPISSDMLYKAGNDCRKKLMTDVTTKALSFLGFSADVFLGLFDDNKYVEATKKEIAKEKDRTSRTDPAGDVLVSKEQRKLLVLASTVRAGEFHERDIDMEVSAPVLGILSQLGYKATAELPEDLFKQVIDGVAKWEP